MDLTFIVADLDQVRTGRIRQEVRSLASLKDFTYRLFTATRPNAWRVIPAENMKAVSIAWICGDYPGALDLGLAIYDANPFCRIIYYGNGNIPLEPLLASRPVRYLDISGGASVFQLCLMEEYSRILDQKQYFHYEDRFQRLAIPYSAIRYFTSRDRMVYCQTGIGEVGPLRRSLDQVAELVDEDFFLRCHKSYLVRTQDCHALEKSNRELVLLDGQRVPVSRSYLGAVMKWFDQNVASDS